MDIQRKLCVAILFGIGSGFVGCQSPGGGFAFRKPSAERSLAAPDVGKQKYEGLAREFPGAMPGTSAATKPTAGMGGARPAESSNVFSSTWSKTTGAVAAAFTRKPGDSLESTDPTSLSNSPKRVGPEVYIGAARLLEGQGRLNEAQVQYEKALSVGPTDLNALVALARLHDRRGNGTKAIELYRRAAKAHPKSPLVQNDMGLCLGRQKQYPQAVEALQRAIALQPGDAKYRNNLATVFVEMGRPDDALAQLSATSPPQVAHYNLGFLLNQIGQRDLAARHFQQALAVDPNMAPAREMLAQIGAAPPGAVAPAEARVAARPVSTQIPSQPGLITAQPIPQPAVQQPAIQPLPAATPYTVRGTSYSISDDEEEASDDKQETETSAPALEFAQEAQDPVEPATIESSDEPIEPAASKEKPAAEDKMAHAPAKPVKKLQPVRAAYYEGASPGEIAEIKTTPSVEQ